MQIFTSPPPSAFLPYSRPSSMDQQEVPILPVKSPNGGSVNVLPLFHGFRIRSTRDGPLEFVRDVRVHRSDLIPLLAVGWFLLCY